MKEQLGKQKDDGGGVGTGSRVWPVLTDALAT